MPDQPDPGGLTRPDDDIAPDLIEADDDLSAFDLLTRVAEEAVKSEDIIKEVPRRPGLSVRYTLQGLDPARWQSINRRATNRKSGQVSTDTAHALLLAEQCTGLFVDGTLVTHDGTPLRFSSGSVRQRFNVDNAADAVRVFFGGPTRNYGFSVMRHATDLLIEAGLIDQAPDDEDDEDDEDPTTAAL